MFYRVDRKGYRPGNILSPGQWPARTDRSAMEKEVEAGLDGVRPDKCVSRLDCVYAFTSLEDADNYQITKNAKLQDGETEYTIYEIEPLEEVHVSYHNYRLFSCLIGNVGFAPPTEQRPFFFEEYWANDRRQIGDLAKSMQLGYVEEALMGGEARIVAEVEPPSNES